MGLIGLLMACYGGLYGILSGLTKSTDHPSSSLLGSVLWEPPISRSRFAKVSLSTY